MTGREPLFGVNNFGKAKIQTVTESIGLALCMVLFNKPGFMPSMPTCGMDINSMLYSFFDKISEEAIETELSRQCPALAEYMSNGTLKCNKAIIKGYPALHITMAVISEGIAYRLVFNFRNTPEGEVVYDFYYNQNDDSATYKKG